MFKCGITNKFSVPNEKPHRLVVERRSKEYAVQRDDGTSYIIGRGWEIVKEINVTLDGLKKWISDHPDDVESNEAYVRAFKAKEQEAEARRRKLTDVQEPT